MSYIVRVSYTPYNYKRDYGTGKDGSGRPFKSKESAQKRASEIRNRGVNKGDRVSVVKV